MIELRRNTAPTDVISLLRDLAREVSNLRAAGGAGIDTLNAWRTWSATALTRSQLLLTNDSVRHLVLGFPFSQLQTLAPADYGPGLAHLVDAELQTRVIELEDAATSVESILAGWERSRLAVVVDTNVLLAAGPRFVQIDWDGVLRRISRGAAFAVPIQVVEELDRLKDRGSGEHRANARHALSWLDEVVGIDGGSRPLETTSPDTTIRVWVDENGRVPLAEVDRDIIERVVHLQPFTRGTIVVSMDRSMVFRARTNGLQASLLSDSDIPPRTR